VSAPSRAGVASPVEVDHLVVAARSLDEGSAWCKATFGVEPQPGGRHASMGTHNRILALSSARFPRCYLEIIAVDPQAPPPARRRWFDLDAPALRAALVPTPRLVHWVARTSDLDATAAALRAAGHDVGTVTAAERGTPRGRLRWRITLREDGCRPAAGALPLLIEWDGEHPTDALPASGVTLDELRLGGIDPALAQLLNVAAGAPAPLVASLAGALGPVTLTGLGTPPPAGAQPADR